MMDKLSKKERLLVDMLKWIGAICIFSATTILGFLFAKKNTDRVKILAEIISSLKMLEAEIMFSHSSLIDAAKKISTAFEGRVSQHYQLFSKKLTHNQTTVSSAWVESVREAYNQSELEKPECDILEHFAVNLGKHDRTTEKKQILFAITSLQRMEQQAIEKEKNNNRMFKSLGTLSGIAMIILLI